ncbi:hypothetical protein WMY93_030314 [Mugilogobius chulae]|uniref:Uncharacterized protein n=1 Tax=Mugilogobius chulae TaxID=88201 RepID=A0AAW0MPR5_9GOBI
MESGREGGGDKKRKRKEDRERERVKRVIFLKLFPYIRDVRVSLVSVKGRAEIQILRMIPERNQCEMRKPQKEQLRQTSESRDQRLQEDKRPASAGGHETSVCRRTRTNL